MIYIANRVTLSLPLLYRQPPVDENLAIWSASHEQENGSLHPPALGGDIVNNVPDRVDLYYALLMSLHKGLPPGTADALECKKDHHE